MGLQLSKSNLNSKIASYRNEIDLGPITTQLSQVKIFTQKMRGLDSRIKALQLRSQNELEPLLKVMEQGNESLLQEENKTRKAYEKLT